MKGILNVFSRLAAALRPGRKLRAPVAPNAVQARTLTAIAAGLNFAPWTPDKGVRPWEVNWKKVRGVPRSESRPLRKIRFRLSRAQRIKDQTKRKEKYLRDLRAAEMNGAWRGQPWVAARFPLTRAEVLS